MTDIKILIVTAHDGNLDFAPICEASWSEFARRHGYDFTARKFAPQSHGNGHPSWQKLALLSRLIEASSHDWILWVDTDTVVTNHKINFSHWGWTPLIYQGSKIEFDEFLFVSKDWNDYSPWSAGVMLVKSCEEALAFLQEAETKTQYRDAGTWDQNAMHDVWNANPQGVKILPRRILQSVPGDVVQAYEPWQPGDWTAHMTGVPNSQKKRYMEIYEGRAIR